MYITYVHVTCTQRLSCKKDSKRFKSACKKIVKYLKTDIVRECLLKIDQAVNTLKLFDLFGLIIDLPIFYNLHKRVYITYIHAHAPRTHVHAHAECPVCILLNTIEMVCINYKLENTCVTYL